MTWETILTSWLVPALIGTVGFFFWEPYKGRILRKRILARIDAEKGIDPGACFQGIVNPNSGVERMGPCFIEEIRGQTIIFRSLIDRSFMVFDGAEVGNLGLRSLPHPLNSREQLFMPTETLWIPPKPSVLNHIYKRKPKIVKIGNTDLLIGQISKPLQKYLAIEFDHKITIFGTYRKRGG